MCSLVWDPADRTLSIQLPGADSLREHGARHGQARLYLTSFAIIGVSQHLRELLPYGGRDLYS